MTIAGQQQSRSSFANDALVIKYQLRLEYKPGLPFSAIKVRFYSSQKIAPRQFVVHITFECIDVASPATAVQIILDRATSEFKYSI